MLTMRTPLLRAIATGLLGLAATAALTVLAPHPAVAAPGAVPSAPDVLELRSLVSTLPSLGNGLVGAYDASQHRYVMASSALVAVLSNSSASPAALALYDRASMAPLLANAVPRLQLVDGSTVLVGAEATPQESGGSVAAVDDPVMGAGGLITARYYLPYRSLTVDLNLSLFSDQQYAVYRLVVTDDFGLLTSLDFDFFDPSTADFQLGGSVAYITDYGRPRTGTIDRTNPEASEQVDEGKPVYLWSTTTNRQVVIAVLDDSGAQSTFAGQSLAAINGVSATVSVRGLSGQGSVTSPRLFLGFPTEANASDALASYRRVFGALHPSVPAPPWFRFEWNSWYTYGMNVNELDFRKQIYAVQQQLGDLGGWLMQLDAGWYVSEGRNNADWTNADPDKFPSGIEALADYAHENGQYLSLYFTAPYVDNRQVAGNWRGMAGLIQAHPEFLIHTDDDALGSGYVIDAKHPSFQAYLKQLMTQFFGRYGVDGVAIDGLGGVSLGLDAVDSVIGKNATGQTMELYRQIATNVRAQRPDAYILGGWHFPLFANPYANAFWYSDESPQFSNPYPFGGVVEHTDYAVLQQAMWGQQSHMGYLIGNGTLGTVDRWWLEAAIALGAEVGLGWDMTKMDLGSLNALRQRLTQYHPHQGENFVIGQYPATAFGSHWEGTTYVGLLNREAAPEDVTLNLADAGLDPTAKYTLLDTTTGSYRVVTGSTTVTLPHESFRLLLLRKDAGVMWTNSSVKQQTAPQRLTVQVGGPAELRGFVEIYAPGLTSLRFDGRPLSLESGDDSPVSYNTATGILAAAYSHSTPHTLELAW